MKVSNNGLLYWLDFDTNEEKTKEPLVVYTRFFNKEIQRNPKNWTCFIIPENTRTDGASIPRLLVPLAGLCGRSKQIRIPSLSHDYMFENKEITLYEFNKETREVGLPIITMSITQKEADYFLEEKMQSMGASFRQRKLTLWGLRLFGWVAWNSYYLK